MDTQRQALTLRPDMSSSESKDNKGKRTGSPFWLQGGLPREGIDLFHAGSLDPGPSLGEKVGCGEL